MLVPTPRHFCQDAVNFHRTLQGRIVAVPMAGDDTSADFQIRSQWSDKSTPRILACMQEMATGDGLISCSSGARENCQRGFLHVGTQHVFGRVPASDTTEDNTIQQGVTTQSV